MLLFSVFESVDDGVDKYDDNNDYDDDSDDDREAVHGLKRFTLTELKIFKTATIRISIMLCLPSRGQEPCPFISFLIVVVVVLLPV